MALRAPGQTIRMLTSPPNPTDTTTTSPPPLFCALQRGDLKWTGAGLHTSTDASAATQTLLSDWRNQPRSVKWSQSAT
ncbi:unnamed protein product [Pleuronectes platessa]|uniref:Uncharacterized protein n=1 Tax=Pleuronectes platessa TaxID=8262 RepID=A0A9N7ZEJ9_PLEPL|nr:unnamed protein product [Pleuronectes platessa]